MKSVDHALWRIRVFWYLLIPIRHCAHIVLRELLKIDAPVPAGNLINKRALQTVEAMNHTIGQGVLRIEQIAVFIRDNDTNLIVPRDILYERAQVIGIDIALDGS